MQTPALLNLRSTSRLFKNYHYLRAYCQWPTLFFLFNIGANGAPISVQALPARQALMLAVLALKQPAIECSGQYVSHVRRVELPLAITLSLGTIRPEDSGAAFQKKASLPGHLGMSGGKSPRHAQKPLLGEWRITLATTHHALTPHPHIIICISFISS